jgi:RNA polymerase sigma factor (sigma-70 family)
VQTFDEIAPENVENVEDVVDLVRRCRSGDDQAWEALIRRYASLINGIGLRYGLGEYDRADVFQAVCIELWQHLGKISDPQRLPGWLITVTGRVCWQHLRQKYVKQERVLNDDDLVTLMDRDLLPEERSLVAERWSALFHAVQNLDGRCRAMVWGLFFDPAQPSYEELSKRLGMAKDSVGPVRLRCLAKLRHALEGQYSPG